MDSYHTEIAICWTFFGLLGRGGAGPSACGKEIRRACTCVGRLRARARQHVGRPTDSYDLHSMRHKLARRKVS